MISHRNQITITHPNSIKTNQTWPDLDSDGAEKVDARLCAEKPSQENDSMNSRLHKTQHCHMKPPSKDSSNIEKMIFIRKTKHSNSDRYLHMPPKVQISHFNLMKLFLKLFVIQIIISQFQPISYLTRTPSQATNRFIIFANALDCETESDCEPYEGRICHENKCICGRDRPIESGGTCLSLHVIDDSCQVDGQCLGNSRCIDGICSCGSEAISLINPSNKLYYCHPKRQLHESCNFDPQCPAFSYCASEKTGCLCQNGYAPALVKQGSNVAAGQGLPSTTARGNEANSLQQSSGNGEDRETHECLAKFCKHDLDCESEFHHCDDSKCKCLPTHFDPNNARCYKFGSTGGVDAASNSSTDDSKTKDNLIDTESVNNFGGSIYTIFNDLKKDSDKMWLLVISLIAFSILILILILLLIRKTALCQCWTVHKQEWDPKVESPNGASLLGHDKNSINNKSFRRKRNPDDLEEDRSNLFAKNGENTGIKAKDSEYRIINFEPDQPSDTKKFEPKRSQMGPITSTTSTPV